MPEFLRCPTFSRAMQIAYQLRLGPHICTLVYVRIRERGRFFFASTRPIDRLIALTGEKVDSYR